MKFEKRIKGLILLRYAIFGLLIIFVNKSVCQVYSPNDDDIGILLGPDNISDHQMVLASQYISYLNDYKLDLIYDLEDELNLIDELNIKMDLMKKLGRVRRKALRSKLEIEEDICGIDSLLYLWNEMIVKRESLIEASELMNQGRCIEFNMSSGMYHSNQVSIEVGKIDGIIEIWETIPLSKIFVKKHLVKKKADKNCLSPNPEDCMIWCIVGSKTGVEFTDIKGSKYNETTCPEDFQFNDLSNECYRVLTFNHEKDVLENVIFVPNENSEVTLPLNWKLVDCF